MTTKRLVRISYFTMLTVVGGLLHIPVPFTPITVTLQTLFVAAAGLVLGAKDGAASQIAYMVLGLVGLPVFTGGGGFEYVLRPTFGYIVGFCVQAFLTGFLVSKQRTLGSFKLFLCAFAGVLAGYAIGITYQVIIIAYYVGSGMGAALLTVPSVLLMLVKDGVLVYLLCLLYPRIKTMIGKPDEKAKDPKEILAAEEPEEKPEENKGGKEPPKNPVPEPAGMYDE